ncbi:hypothetical protein VHEMI01955 [[Torrubiella] hemipterigena]|uniref:2EXR domain-containing protein n=1 Tax=[Torrubiella] hemipterigena TaxID=1531966 RepID=A0A0A1SUE2_9HYPO|nr:hypothetical protein VHEMI01955 [[Torrubiella] hemipterigena]
MSTILFQHFSKLPLELQNQIWDESLPEKDAPAVFFYKPGCWEVHVPVAGDKRFDPDRPGRNWFVFFEDRLAHTHVCPALLRVNAEARRAALRWAHRLGYKLQWNNRNQPVITRPMDRETDTLYLPDEHKEEYFTVTEDLMDQTDSGHSYTNDVDDRPVAMSQGTISKDPLGLIRAFREWIHNTYLIHAVVGIPLPETDLVALDPGLDNVQLRRWELRDAQQPNTYGWNRSKACFLWEDLGHQTKRDNDRMSDVGEEDMREWAESAIDNEVDLFAAALDNYPVMTIHLARIQYIPPWDE